MLKRKPLLKICLLVSVGLLLFLLFSVIYDVVNPWQPHPKVRYDGAMKSDIGQLGVAIDTYFSDFGMCPSELEVLAETEMPEDEDSYLSGRTYLRRIPKVPNFDEPNDLSPEPGGSYGYLVNKDRARCAVYAQIIDPLNESKPYWGCVKGLGVEAVAGEFSKEEIEIFVYGL